MDKTSNNKPKLSKKELDKIIAKKEKQISKKINTK